VFNARKNSVSYIDNNFYVLDLSIPANLNFCDEKIPQNNYEIKDDLKREFFNSSYWKTNSVGFFKKAQRWFPVIEPILKEEGVPDDFKYLAVIESHLSNSSSPAGAAGFWQLLPGSARNYGLEVNSCVDERYNVEMATHAACRHIKDAYKIFKNWTLSAAAYNLGIGGIISALRRQKTDNYFDLLLNRETGSFVYRILAYKTLFSSPGHFGIKKKKLSHVPKIAFTTFRIDSSITNLETFAKKINCNKALIKSFNPWLLCNLLDNPNKKIYEIKIPKNINLDYTAYIEDLDRDKKNSANAKQNITSSAVDSLIVDPNEHFSNGQSSDKTLFHTFKESENLKDLAKKYAVTEDQLRQWNEIDEKNPKNGQVLIVKKIEKK